MISIVNKLIAVIMLFLANPVFACSVCYYGEPGDKSNTALRLSVLTLLLILCGVLAAVIRFLIRFNKRIKALESQAI